MPARGHSCRRPVDFPERWVRGRVSTLLVGTHVLRHGVSLLTLCPLGQPKKAIGHESQIEPWFHIHMQPFCLLRFRNRIESKLFLSLSGIVSERSSPHGVLRRAETARPWPLPGRSEKAYPDKRERRVWKLMTRHLNISSLGGQIMHALLASRHLHSGRGAGCRNFSRLPARRRSFFS